MQPHEGAIWPEELYLTLPPTPGPQAPGKVGRPLFGDVPALEKFHFDLDGSLQQGVPLAGKLPNGAQEVQSAALQELHMHLTLAETMKLKTGCFLEIKLP